MAQPPQPSQPSQPPDLLEWLPLDVAARRWGYSREGLRRRLRQLRQHGYVADLGRPPEGYVVADAADAEGRVRLLWANPQTALIHAQVPAGLFDPKKGRRTTPLSQASQVSQVSQVSPAPPPARKRRPRQARRSPVGR